MYAIVNGIIIPKGPLTDAKKEFAIGGMQVSINNDRVEVRTPNFAGSNEEAEKLVERSMKSFLNLLTLYSEQRLELKITGSSVPKGNSGVTTVASSIELYGKGYSRLTSQMWDEALSHTETIASNNIFLELALEDFAEAIDSHARDAIFRLFRAFEAAENYFGGRAEMRRELGFSENFVKYVAKRANEIRHVPKRDQIADLRPLTKTEEKEIFSKVKQIIESWLEYLRTQSHSEQEV